MRTPYHLHHYYLCHHYLHHSQVWLHFPYHTSSMIFQAFTTVHRPSGFSLDAGDKTYSICCSYFFLLLWFTKFTLVCLYPHLPVSSIVTSIKIFQPCQTMNKPFNPPLYGFPLPCTPSTFIWVLEMAGNFNNLASYLLIYARVSKLK